MVNPQKETWSDTSQSLPSLLDRYDIEYTLFKKENDEYISQGSGELKEDLKGPKEKTMLGRKPPKDSVFHHGISLPLDDMTVSKMHFYLTQNELEELICVDVSANGSIATDYKGQDTLLKREDENEMHDPSKRRELSAVLVPAGFNEDNAAVYIGFGGKNQDNYQLKIIFERKIEIGQLKKDSSPINI